MTHDPSLSYSACLILSAYSSQVANSSETKYFLSSTEEVLIGREVTCQIAVNSEQYPTVSRHHAKIQSFEDGSRMSWHIYDLNAANGTYVNGKRLQGYQILQPGDRVMLGKDGPEFLFECQVVSEPLLTTSEPNPAEVMTSESRDDLSVLELTPIDTSIIPQISSHPINITTQPVITVPDVTTQSSPRSLWDLVTDERIIVLSGHTDLIRGVAFSPDGKFVASGSADKTIKIWNIALCEESQTFSGYKLAVSAVAFSPDGKLLASGSADKTIKIWDLKSNEEVQTITGHNMGVSAIAFSSDNKFLASSSADKTIRIWDLKSTEVVHTLAGHKMGVNAVAFSPDVQLLASGSADRIVKLWKVESGEELLTLPTFRSSINALFFSPNGELLAISTDDKMIRIWNWRAEQELRVFSGYSWQIGSIAISSNGQMLACGSEDKMLKIWSI
ncbi:FHA domain-containing protein [Nostoc sp. UHCC 0702]|nr:FHA domain-containing protein [Nostoc sp. UHCC 0702]